MKFKELADKYKPTAIENEGNVAHLYLCPEGYPTIGIGCRVFNTNDMKKLPFYKMKDKEALLATDEEKETEYQNIQKEKYGKKYSANWYQSKTTLFLKEDAIDLLYVNRTIEFLNQLTQSFKNFESYPEDACLALLDMAYNLGVPGLIDKFPKLVNAIRGTDKPDWIEVAKQCHRKPPVSEERNRDTKRLFEKAAQHNESKRQSSEPLKSLFFSKDRTSDLSSSNDSLEMLLNALDCKDAVSFYPGTGGR